MLKKKVSMHKCPFQILVSFEVVWMITYQEALSHKIFTLQVLVADINIGYEDIVNTQVYLLLVVFHLQSVCHYITLYSSCISCPD